MKINIEIVKKAIIYDKKSIEELKTKELVKKMMLRRRLSRSAKVLTYLADECEFTKGVIVYGTAYGELIDSVAILQSINNSQVVSPTNFQNSVYNTAVSYHSILHGNKSEILTLSCGDNTSYAVMQQGALSSLSNKEVFLCSIEAMNFEGVEVLNKCNDYLEYAIAFVIRRTYEPATIKVENINQDGVPNSLLWMKNLYDECERNSSTCIIKVEL